MRGRRDAVSLLPDAGGGPDPLWPFLTPKVGGLVNVEWSGNFLTRLPLIAP